MGHHINEEGRFQSDKYPDLDPDKIVLSFKDPNAHGALRNLAYHYDKTDPELADDIRLRLRTIRSLNQDKDNA